jgi:hypothetical protein
MTGSGAASWAGRALAAGEQAGSATNGERDDAAIAGHQLPVRDDTRVVLLSSHAAAGQAAARRARIC